MIFVLRQLVCNITGHRFVVTQEFHGNTRRMGCTRCRRSWAMHDEFKLLLPWCRDFHDLYTWLGDEVIYLEWERCGDDRRMKSEFSVKA